MIADGERSAATEARKRASLNTLVLLVLAALAVVVAALATATALRPREGYTSSLHLLAALMIGASAVVLALLVLTTLVVSQKASRSRAPLLRRLTLTAVAAALLLAASVQALHAGATPQAAGSSAAAATFARWQRRVVPVVVAYASVIRADASLLRSLPRTRQRIAAAQTRVAAGARSLARLRPPPARAGRLSPDEPTLPQLTRLLNRSLGLARQGQAALAAGLAALAAAPASRSAGRALIAESKRELRQSQQAMATFTVEANALGGRLNAQP